MNHQPVGTFIFVVAAIVLLSRLPFLNAGYGNDNDAWRVASTARHIATTGQYSTSRPPGYPVQEIVCSIIWKGGPIALNGATALFSALAVSFFGLALAVLGCKDYVLATLALAFTPIVFINSTNSMDYLWALAFILGSFYFVLTRRPGVGGIFLGVAIGCRITSGAMIVPFSLLLIQEETIGNTIKQILKFCLAACLVGAAAFAPVFLEYGWQFFTFYESGYPPVIDVIKKSTVEIWGRIGLLAMLVAGVSLIVNLTLFRTRSFMPVSVAKSQTTAWVVVICIYVAAFLRFPQEPAYLIPMLPFVILLLWRLLNRRLFIFVCIAILVSSFVSISPAGIAQGPIFADHSSRIEAIKSVEGFIAHENRLQQKSVIVTGHWYPKIEVYLFGKPHRIVEYVWLLDESLLQKYLNQAYNVYYLPGARESNRQTYGVDLAEYGAVQLIAQEKQE